MLPPGKVTVNSALHPPDQTVLSVSTGHVPLSHFLDSYMPISRNPFELAMRATRGGQVYSPNIRHASRQFNALLAGYKEARSVAHNKQNYALMDGIEAKIKRLMRKATALHIKLT